MPESQPDKPQQVSLLDLAQALAEMRDALVCVSLDLREYQFNCDSMGRAEAQEHLRVLMGKVKGS